MKQRRALFLLALAALPLLVYLPALSNHELIWDSKPMIMENKLLQGAFSPLAPFRSGYWSATSQETSSRYDYYRPLTVLSFMIEKAIWGLSPFRLRLANLLIFIAALVGLYFFLLRQGAPPGVAETAAALYALFPLHLDNINWVVSRCELLMLLFGVLSLLLFDHFLEKRRPWLGLLALASFALALFSKEAALFFLPLFPLHEHIRRRRLTLPIYILPLLVTAGFWLVKSAVIGRGGFPIRPFPGIIGKHIAGAGGARLLCPLARLPVPLRHVPADRRGANRHVHRRGSGLCFFSRAGSTGWAASGPASPGPGSGSPRSSPAACCWSSPPSTPSAFLRVICWSRPSAGPGSWLMGCIPCGPRYARPSWPSCWPPPPLP